MQSFFPRILKPLYLKITLSAHTPGMHHALGNLLPVELAQLLKQVVVLKQYRTCTETLGHWHAKPCIVSNFAW